MIERIIDLSSEPVFLSVNLERLAIERKDQPTIYIPLDEVGVVVSAHRAVTFTQAALADIAARGGVVVVCDAKSMPAAMLLPLERHHLQADRFEKQAAAPLPLKKGVWRQIVQAKVRAQARLLVDLHGDDHGLAHMAEKVKSGDTENIEGQAARRYWPVLFGDPAFRRQREGAGPNHLLNYGYAVLRAQAARAVCAAGLHPSLGVHHHNQYDAYCLADDVMEPFRPIVDRQVVDMVGKLGAEVPLEKETKGMLIGALTERRTIQGESRTLFDILSITASSLAKVFLGEAKSIALPDL